MSEDKQPIEEKEEKRVTGIKIPTPWGVFEVRGLGTILSLTLAALVLIGNWVWDGKAEHGKIVAAVESVENTMAEQTYVLTLPQQQREALNLSMPHTLRNKIRRNEQ